MMADVRVEIWHEMSEQDWTPNDVAQAMGGDIAVNRLILDLVFAIDDPTLHLGDDTAEALGRAFDVPAAFFLSLEHAADVQEDDTHDRR
jgi:plasmid maintenance system antidote protein VapI